MILSDPVVSLVVTNITNTISGERIVLWRNFSFPCMTIVGKLKISPHVEKFHMSPHDRCADVEKSKILHIWHVCDVENVAIYSKFMQFLVEKLSPKVHLWRKNDKYEVCCIIPMYVVIQDKQKYVGRSWR